MASLRDVAPSATLPRPFFNTARETLRWTPIPKATKSMSPRPKPRPPRMPAPGSPGRLGATPHRRPLALPLPSQLLGNQAGGAALLIEVKLSTEAVGLQ